MLLPEKSLNEAQKPLEIEQTPVVLQPYLRQRLDKALIDKAITLKTLESLSDFFAQLRGLALDAESESVKLAAIQYLFDRAGGKPVQIETKRVEGEIHIKIDI